MSIATPLVCARVFDKWFSSAKKHDRQEWQPFALTVSIFLLAFAGLTYSLLP